MPSGCSWPLLRSTRAHARGRRNAIVPVHIHGTDITNEQPQRRSCRETRMVAHFCARLRSERASRRDTPGTLDSLSTHITDDVPPDVVWIRDRWVGLNRLTSGDPVLTGDTLNLFP